MAFANRLQCFACNRRGRPQQMVRIFGPEMVQVAEIATDRRNGNRLPLLDINENTRICIICYQAIRHDIEVRPLQNAIRLNVLVIPGGNSCIFCNNLNDIHELSIKCKVDIFLQCNIYCPPRNVRACNHHLDGRNYIQRPLLRALQCVNRYIAITPQDIGRFLGVLSEVSQEKWYFNDIYDLTDTEVYNLTSTTRENFEELFNYCPPVPRARGHYTIKRKDLLMFLCKMKQGLSDEFLSTMFQYPSRQSTSLAVAMVRQSLMMRFVPENLGLTAITREQYINQHVIPFANHLYNAVPQRPLAITILDGTYTFCHKSKNFRVQRQTYCTHKSRNLIKPALMVVPDGYILDIHGPYFSDAPNNDAAMIINEFLNDDLINHWFEAGDILIVDRGYRGALPLLNDSGFDVRMPPLLEEGEHQLTTEHANQSRMITKFRWVVEGRNGHIKSI